MLELKALLLTQGMHGMVSQVEGLAKALGLGYKHQKIELKSFWNFIPPKISPISENLVKNKFVCDCKIIISCGRKSDSRAMANGRNERPSRSCRHRDDTRSYK